jgi:hypothetical protein
MPLAVRGDEEAAPSAYVQTDEWGHYYAKSVPTDAEGKTGVTRVYNVREKEDVVFATYDWYAPRMALHGTGKGISVVRFGRWARGHEATADELALAFYLNEKMLHSYSTLDIAGKPDNVSFSVSHYTVIRKVMGYRWIKENEWAFEIETTDGRVLSFDPDTGEMIRGAATMPATRGQP